MYSSPFCTNYIRSLVFEQVLNLLSCVLRFLLSFSMLVSILTMKYGMTLPEHGHAKYKCKNYSYPFNYRCMSIHGNIGGIAPISLRRPSEKSPKIKNPTNILMIPALRLCFRIASSIITFTSSLVTYPGGGGSFLNRCPIPIGSAPIDLATNHASADDT